MCSVFPTCAEPWNITCSNRCAKPVLPLTSCFEPTLYQTFTAATGARWSSEMIKRSPLGRRVWVKSTLGTGTAPMLGQNDEEQRDRRPERGSLEEELREPS